MVKTLNGCSFGALTVAPGPIRPPAFVQSYGSKELDASLLMIPLVGFLPPGDPRVAGTVQAIERELVRNGFVMRYPTASGVDGLPPESVSIKHL